MHLGRTRPGGRAGPASTLLVFALLSLSTIPVLRAIGSTVALGVLSNFVLALLVVRRPVPAGAPP